MIADIIYFHQSLKQPDASNFVQSVAKEVNRPLDNIHWKLIKHSNVPKNVEIVPSVWAMNHKHNLTTNVITKYKARLNIHRSKQTYGINYFETYAPVVTAGRLCHGLHPSYNRNEHVHGASCWY